jgi:predicted acyl esterase
VIEWAAGQPWSTGKVGMTGVSYLTYIQWFVAALNPPHLAAVAMTSPNSSRTSAGLRVPTR